MAKSKVKISFMDIKRYLGKQVQDQVGRAVVSEMKEFVNQGYSPVKGIGRFVGYKATRSSQEVKSFTKLVRKDQGGYYRQLAKRLLSKSNFYPNSVRNKYPSKTISPVNLNLSGEFIDTISHSATRDSVTVGHIKFDKRTKDLFEAHNEGLNKNVPQRKYLPNKRGEEFIVSIMRLIKQIYSDRLKQILKK